MLSRIAYVQPVLAAIIQAGGRPHVVGGAVRDLLRGVPVNDVDVEVYGLPIDRLVEVLSAFGRVDAVGRSFGILKLRMPSGREIDVALPRRESKIGAGHRGFLAEPDPTMTPHEAAARRDFTWNALALTPAGELLDFFGGVADFDAGLIRHTTAAFAEDPLRVLRAMQFAGRFDMRLAPETAELCRQLLPEAATLATERVWGEWHKWALTSTRPAAGLRVLAETGWLTLYPELAALVDCPQDAVWHPEGWSLAELPLQSSPARPAEAGGGDLGLSFRDFITSASATPAVIPTASGASGTQALIDCAVESLTVADRAGANNFDPASTLGPTTVANPKSLVWRFGATTVDTREVARIVFKIPLRYVKSVMSAAIDDFEVVKRIVHPVTIYVMNMLPRFQGATKLQFHDDTMDSDSSVLSGPSSIHVPIVVVDARTSAVDGNIFFDFDLAIKRNDDVAHVFDYNTRHRVFQVSLGDSWLHTLHVCDAAAEIAARAGLADDERTALLFAALCHDLGKPTTTQIGADGRVRSPGHAQAGIDPSASFLARVGAPRALVARVLPLVREHMAHLAGPPSQRAVRRLAVRLEPATIAQWGRLVAADHAGRPPLPPSTPGAPFVEAAQGLSVAHGPPAPLLLGRHLIERGVQPGAQLGALLKQAYQAQLDGVFDTVEGGLAWADQQAGK